MIVVDANILVRAVLGRRVRQLLETYSAQGVRFFAPDVAFEDAKRHLPTLLRKHGKPEADLAEALAYLEEVVEAVAPDAYAFHETDARERLRGRDEDDWPVLATAIALACPIWTEDMDFFGTGVAVWTTSRVEILLRGEVADNEPDAG